MRARTKFDQHWVVVIRESSGAEYHRGPPLIGPKYAWRRVPSEREREAKHGRTVHVVRVTRYRLAPLIELPAWRTGKSTDPWPERAMVVESGAHDVHAWVDVDRWGIGDDPYWGNASVLGEGAAGSIGEARAACESRLRELGYRVAKA